MPIIRVEMLKGRTHEQKQQLAKELTETFCKIANGRPEAVQVLITDVEKENWASGGVLHSDK